MVVLAPSESSLSTRSGHTPLPQARRNTTMQPLEHHHRSTALSRSYTRLATARSTSPHHPQCHSTKVRARFGRFWSRRRRHSSNELAARRGRPLALLLSPLWHSCAPRGGQASASARGSCSTAALPGRVRITIAPCALFYRAQLCFTVTALRPSPNPSPPPRSAS